MSIVVSYNGAVVLICNLALAKLGDSADVTSIFPPDGSAQSVLCNRLYNYTLGVLLDRYAWSFAIQEANLISIENPIDTWQYAYAVPGDLQSVINVRDSAFDDQRQFPNTQNYSLQGGMILSNIDAASIVYTVSTAVNPALFPPLFTEAFVCLLAANLAGPIIKGDTGVSASQKLIQEFERVLQLAINSDAAQRQITPRYIPAAIAARA